MKQLSWGPFQQEGTKISCQALLSLGQLCLLLIKSCHPQGRSLGALCVGTGFLKNCLLATLRVTCCVPQTKTGPGKKRTEDRMIGAAGKCTPRGNEGTWKWGNLSFCYCKVFWSFHLIICLNILKRSINFHDIYEKTGTRLYYRADLNPAILLLEPKYVAVYTQGKVFCFPSIQTWGYLWCNLLCMSVEWKSSIQFIVWQYVQ